MTERIGVSPAMTAASAGRESAAAAVWARKEVALLALLRPLTQLLRQPGENKRVCSPCGSSSLLPASACPLPAPGSLNGVHSVNSETTDVTNRIHNTAGVAGRIHRR